MKKAQRTAQGAASVCALKDSFLGDVRTIIATAQSNAVRSVEFHRVEMYWKLGERIFVEEQQEQDRAEYGSYLIANLAAALEHRSTGAGFPGVSWSGRVSFIASTQLRPRCGRN